MKRMTSLIFVVLLLLVAVSVQAGVVGVVKTVQMAQTTGAYAEYNPDLPGTVEWKGGASGWLMTGTYEFESFGKADIEATYTFVDDTSSGGVASATFDTGIWVMTLKDMSDVPVIIVEGHIAGLYHETEVGDGHLDGRAVTYVDEFWYDPAYFIASGLIDAGDEIIWDGGEGSLGGIIGDITLPEGIDDYVTGYLSTNAIITVYADEGVIPEPATLALLGFGALSLIRRRKA